MYARLLCSAAWQEMLVPGSLRWLTPRLPVCLAGKMAQVEKACMKMLMVLYHAIHCVTPTAIRDVLG